MSSEDDFPEDLLVFKKLTRLRRQTSGSESDADALSLHSMASKRSVATNATTATSVAASIGLRRNRTAGSGGSSLRIPSRLSSLANLLPGRRSAPVVCDSPPPEAEEFGAVVPEAAAAVATVAPVADPRRFSRRQLDIRACLQELSDLESRFHNRMECAMRVYCEPLLQSSMPEIDVREMFYNMSELNGRRRRGRRSLEERLKQCLDQMREGSDDDWDAGNCGSALLAWATEEAAEGGSLGRVVAYCSHLNVSRQAYDRLNQRPRFREFLQRSLSMRRSLKGLDLWSHLHEPKSHIARYPLILNRLAVYLADIGNKSEAARVREAYDIVCGCLTAIDAGMLKEDMRRLAKKLLLDDGCLPPNLLEPWRWLLQRQTSVVDKTAPGLVRLMPKRRPVVLVLTDDLLIVLKADGGSVCDDTASQNHHHHHQQQQQQPRCRQALLLCGLSASISSGLALLNLRGLQLAPSATNSVRSGIGSIGRRPQISQRCRQQPQQPPTSPASLSLSFGQNLEERSHWLALIQSTHICTPACHGSGATVVTEAPLRQGSQNSTESGYCTDH